MRFIYLSFSAIAFLVLSVPFYSDQTFFPSLKTAIGPIISAFSLVSSHWTSVSPVNQESIWLSRSHKVPGWLPGESEKVFHERTAPQSHVSSRINESRYTRVFPIAFYMKPLWFQSNEHVTSMPLPPSMCLFPRRKPVQPWPAYIWRSPSVKGDHSWFWSEKTNISKSFHLLCRIYSSKLSI